MRVNKKQNIIIFAHQGLGDCIMMLPALSKFISEDNDYIIYCKSRYESTVFDLLKKSNIKFEYRHKKVGSIHDAFKLLFFSIKQRIKGVDKIYAPMLPGNIFYYFILKIIKALDTYVTNENYFSSFDILLPAYWNYEGHYVKYFNDFFNIVDNETTTIYRSINTIMTTDSTSENIIGIGPGSGITELNKIPSLEWYIELVKQLRQNFKNIKFIYYGGGKYDEKLINILEKMYPEISKCLLNMKIEDLITELSACKLIISGTTGPGHLASLTTKPLIILANSTNVFESAPYSDKISFITNYNVFKCAPCYRRNFNNGCGELKCLNTLSHEEVINRVKELFINSNNLRNDYTLSYIVKTKNKIHLEI